MNAFLVSSFIWMILAIHNSVQQFSTPFGEVSMTAVEDLSQNIEVACGFDEELGPAQWVINGTVFDHDVDIFPCFVSDSRYAIQIPEVFLCLNDTTFQCVTSNVHPPGRVTRLIIFENPSSTSNNHWDCEDCIYSVPVTFAGVEELMNDELEINIQTLVIHDNNVTTFEILFPINCNASNIQIHVYNYTNNHLIRTISSACCNLSISSPDILTNDKKVVALKINSDDCQDETDFITINDTPTNQSIININESTCIQFPNRTEQCDENVYLNLVISSDCYFALPRYKGNLKLFQGCENFTAFNVSVNDSRKTVCFHDWEKNFTSTVVHFSCVLRYHGNSVVYHYIASHQLIADPSTLKSNLSDRISTPSVSLGIEDYLNFSSTIVKTDTSGNQSTSPNDMTDSSGEDASGINIIKILLPIISLFMLSAFSVLVIIAAYSLYKKRHKISSKPQHTNTNVDGPAIELKQS